MEMGRKGFEMLVPYGSAIFTDEKGVDSFEIEELKMVEVRWYGIKSGIVIQVDVDLPGILE